MTTTDVTSTSTSGTPAPSAPPDRLGADKSTFLKLLVAQLQNQNPLNPADGVQFVTQLAQFTALEQSTRMTDDISAIRDILAKSETSTASGTQTS
jgi:flagellar basal-body rod modification protein FlgD